jgi:hypothetical protein
MGIEAKTKLNSLLSQWPDGHIVTSKWLKKNGYEPQLVQKYKKGRWLQPLGSGAYKKYNDNVGWSSAVECIQTQLKLQVHVGGKTALDLLGHAQYIALNQTEILLYGSKKAALPSWMKNYPWEAKMLYQAKNLFSKRLEFGEKLSGFTKLEVARNSIIASSPERAYLEYLDELPTKYSYQEAKAILENLISTRGGAWQNLLQNCNSVKVKRLFLHFAEKVAHPWLDKLDVSKIELGSGKRVIFKRGVLDLKYQITIPKNESHETI